MRIAAHATNERDLTPIWNAGMSALEILGIGWLACDASGRLLYANETASRIFKARFGLWRTLDGRLWCHANSDPLMVAIQKAAAGKLARNSPDGNDTLLLQRTNQRTALTLLVRPLQQGWIIGAPSQTGAIVLILDPSLSVETTAAELSQLCGFTATEARFANLLMDGLPLDRCVARLHCQHTTARAHLKRMLRKTGTRHQSELVRLLLKTIGLVRLKQKKAKLLAQITEGLIESQVVSSPFCAVSTLH